jgi:hypothetical protein
MGFFRSLLQAWNDKRALLREIAGTVRLELSIVEAYDVAIREIGLPGPADQLAQFRNEHLAHIQDLIGGIRPLARRLAGPVQDALRREHPNFQGLRATDGTERALQELRAREAQMKRAWEAITLPLPRSWDVHVRRFCEDEERHVRFLENLLANRVWAFGEAYPEM